MPGRPPASLVRLRRELAGEVVARAEQVMAEPAQATYDRLGSLAVADHIADHIEVPVRIALESSSGRERPPSVGTRRLDQPRLE